MIINQATFPVQQQQQRLQAGCYRPGVDCLEQEGLQGMLLHCLPGLMLCCLQDNLILVLDHH
jgi:hypothetical protein